MSLAQSLHNAAVSTVHECCSQDELAPAIGQRVVIGLLCLPHSLAVRAASIWAQLLAPLLLHPLQEGCASR